MMLLRSCLVLQLVSTGEVRRREHAPGYIIKKGSFSGVSLGSAQCPASVGGDVQLLWVSDTRCRVNEIPSVMSLFPRCCHCFLKPQGRAGS